MGVVMRRRGKGGSVGSVLEQGMDTDVEAEGESTRCRSGGDVKARD